MAIVLDDSVLVGQQKAVDSKYDNDGVASGYLNISECKSVITLGLRYSGLTVKIAGVEYWWPPNDNDLTKDPVIKEQGGGSGSIPMWEDKSYNKNENVQVESPVGYYTVYVAKANIPIGYPKPGTSGSSDWVIVNNGAFLPTTGVARQDGTLIMERAQVLDNLNFSGVESGIGLHYIVDLSGKVLRLNRFPSDSSFDPLNDIVRYYSDIKKMEIRWPLILSNITLGDNNDEVLLLDSNGYVKKIPFSSLTVTTTNTPEQDSEEPFNADGAYNLQTQINQLSSDKLDKTDYQQHFRGKFPSLIALETNVFDPPLISGDYAQVDEGLGVDVKNYNWDADDNVWVEGGSGSAATNTDQLPEGSTNLYFTTARVLATILSGLGIGTNTAISATDTILQAFAKLQNQITSHTGDTGNPHAVTKAQVGLSNVDNTSDANKPISTATQNALDTKADLPNGKISGGDLTVVSTNTIRISASSWRILPNVYQTTADTDFPSIVNSSAGKQRFIAFFGNTSNQVIKVEGTEGSIATMPSTPANTVLINSVIVNDAGIGTAIPPDLSGYAKYTDTGDKNNLLTTNKNTIVEGINEVYTDVSNLSQDNITLKIFKVSNYATL